jgi:hypothetical protein
MRVRGVAVPAVCPESEPMTDAPLEAAREYLARGWFPVPVPFRQKAPLLDGWSQLRLTVESVGAHFTGPPQNVGILLGTLADVDCDAREAIAAAPDYLPPTSAIHGRPSKRASHWWYLRDQTAPTMQFRDTDSTMLVELRGEGGHSLAPPSVHPSGEPFTWAKDGEPAPIDGRELEAAVARVAAVALIARHWPRHEGGRHQLALAGFLLRGELDEELAARLIGSAARIAGDPERSDRVRAVRTTAGRLETGEPITATFARLITDGGVIEGLLTRWLRLRVPHPRLTDLGNSERFVAQHGEDIRYCYAFRSWFVWTGQQWGRDPGDATTRLAKATVRTIYAEVADARNPDDRKLIVQWAQKSEAAERVRALLELAKSEVAIRPEDFDRDPFLLNCPNGTLELRTLALRPHRREDFITKLPRGRATGWVRRKHGCRASSRCCIRYVSRRRSGAQAAMRALGACSKSSPRSASAGLIRSSISSAAARRGRCNRSTRAGAACSSRRGCGTATRNSSGTRSRRPCSHAMPPWCTSSSKGAGAPRPCCCASTRAICRSRIWPPVGQLWATSGRPPRRKYLIYRRY